MGQTEENSVFAIPIAFYSALLYTQLVTFRINYPVGATKSLVFGKTNKPLHKRLSVVLVSLGPYDV